MLQSQANLSTARDAQELVASVNGCSWARFGAEHKPDIYDEVCKSFSIDVDLSTGTGIAIIATRGMSKETLTMTIRIKSASAHSVDLRW